MREEHEAWVTRTAAVKLSCGVMRRNFGQDAFEIHYEHSRAIDDALEMDYFFEA